MNTIPIRPFAAVKLLTLTALALVLLLLNGCRWTGVKGNGDIVTDTRRCRRSRPSRRKARSR